MGHDIPGRSSNIAMEEGHAFGTPRAPAGVQDQSNIVRRWGGADLALRLAGDPHESPSVPFERVYGSPPRSGGLPRRSSVVIGKTEQDLGARVFQVETHLVFP